MRLERQKSVLYLHENNYKTGEMALAVAIGRTFSRDIKILARRYDRKGRAIDKYYLVRELQDLAGHPVLRLLSGHLDDAGLFIANKYIYNRPKLTKEVFNLDLWELWKKCNKYTRKTE